METENVGKYFLQNCTAGFVGNSPLFWAKGDSGYTPWVAEAKEWTKEEAVSQVQGTRGTHTWKLWRAADVRRLAKRTVDMQDLNKLLEPPTFEEGDAVTRILGGQPMTLKVTEVTDDLITCGSWTFCPKTGAEIDAGLDWGPPPMQTGSFLQEIANPVRKAPVLSESGHYWCYTLDVDGNPLETEGKPSIVWYQKADEGPGEVQLLGYDVPLPYHPKKYQLLERVEY